MTVHAILTDATARALAPLFAGSPWRDATVVYRLEPGQGPAALGGPGRVRADLLLVDIDTGPGLGPAVERYHAEQPRTRIILWACGRKPDDVEVATAVRSGVCEVVVDRIRLGEALSDPVHRTQVARRFASRVTSREVRLASRAKAKSGRPEARMEPGPARADPSPPPEARGSAWDGHLAGREVLVAFFTFGVATVALRLVAARMMLGRTLPGGAHVSAYAAWGLLALAWVAAPGLLGRWALAARVLILALVAALLFEVAGAVQTYVASFLAVLPHP